MRALTVCFFLFACTGASLEGANQHYATSANPITGNITIEVLDEEFNVSLHSRGTEYSKYPSGDLKRLRFSVGNVFYDIGFYQKGLAFKEKVKYVKRYGRFHDVTLLEGKVQSFSPTGELLSSTGWSQGTLHGEMVVYDPMTLELVEKRHYMNGFPVGVWTVYHKNGNKAQEIVFPPSDIDWHRTVKRGSNLSSIHTQDFLHPLKVVQTDYYPSGKKMKTMSYSCYEQNQRPIITAMHDAVSYDKQGRQIKTTSDHGVYVKEHISYRSLDLEYASDIYQIDDSIFKVENFRRP